MRRFKKTKWGWWIVLWRKPHFKVKLLRFRKGGSISMQKHTWRNELWLILKGKGYPITSKICPIVPQALVQCRKGEYLLIPRRVWHRFTAIKATWVLEIQFGELCDENDIERKDVW